MKQRTGFTLVEILVVVAIVSLLATLGTLSVSKAMDSSREKTAKTELELLASGILQLAWDTGSWPNKAFRNTPGSTEIWSLGGAAAGLMQTDGSYSEWKGPYYEGSLLDPWGQPYFFDPDYLIKGVNHVVVGSFGPNRIGRNVYDSDDLYVILDD